MVQSEREFFQGLQERERDIQHQQWHEDQQDRNLKNREEQLQLDRQYWEDWPWVQDREAVLSSERREREAEVSKERREREAAVSSERQVREAILQEREAPLSSERQAREARFSSELQE